MARPSTVDKLPDAIKELIGRLRQSGRTIDEISAKLRELEIVIPRSTLARHTKELDELSEQLRESMELSRALQERVFDDPDRADATARMNQQLGQAVMFKFLRAMQSKGAAEIDGKELGFVMGALDKLAKAEKSTADLRAQLKAEAEKEKLRAVEAERAACAERAVEVLAGEKGLSRGTVETIKARILGVKAPAP